MTTRCINSRSLSLVVTHQLQVERRTGKIRQSETDVLPLWHATNYRERERSLFTMSEHNKYKLDNGRLPERNNHHSWPPILRQRLVATWAEFQHSVLYYATERCRKRLKACINAEGGHYEHLLWYCLPDIPVATRHNRLFSEQQTTTHNWLSSEPPTSERMQQPFSQMKIVSQFTKLLWWHFQVG